MLTLKRKDPLQQTVAASEMCHHVLYLIKLSTFVLELHVYEYTQDALCSFTVLVLSCDLQRQPLCSSFKFTNVKH